MNCPECGKEIPEEVGQRALVPLAGVVQCPSCGATVTLGKEGDGEPESFSGHETIEGVMEEIREKEES